MGMFYKRTKKRLMEESDRNKSVNSWVVDYIFNHIENKWVMPNTEPCRKRELSMKAAYICLMYGYYLLV